MTKSTAKRKEGAMERLSEYKMEVLNRCLGDQELVKLIKHDVKDALFQEDISEEESSSMLYDRVFPYRFVPNPTGTQGTFLTLGTGGFRKHQEGWKIYDDYEAGEIYFYFFTHIDLMRTYNGVRQDLILGRISSLFNGTKGIGMGELKLRYVNELWMHNNKFGGYTVAFTMTDFK